MSRPEDRTTAGPGVPDPVVPAPVLALLDGLWAAGHAAYVVGGCLRDELLGREADDWDLATDARPERILELHAGALYKNRFGTVIVRRDEADYELTTFRSDHEYEDFRRPTRVEFGETDRKSTRLNSSH